MEVAETQEDSLADPEYIQEYEGLKQQLLDNTRKSGGFVALYLLLAVNGQAALAASLGTVFSYVYMKWIIADVDAVKATDRVALSEAKQIELPGLRSMATLAAVYSHALRPRLAVPLSLGLLVAAYNRMAGEPLPLLYDGCLLAGFLSYKGALGTAVVQALSPKSYAKSNSRRPVLENIPDDLDQWGRPRRRATPLPTVVMPNPPAEEDIPIVNE